MALRLYTRFVALSTAVLIFAGGLVTSTGSGLSVPDWPNTYGWFMFTFPLDKMVGMPAGRLFRGRTIINLFRDVTTADAMIFNSGKAVPG